MLSDTLLRCSACRNGLPDSAHFCPSCGRTTQRAALDTASDFQEHRRPSSKLSSAMPSMRLPARQRLSVYRIERVIGEGGMGVVYRAYDEALDRQVALKCLHSNLAGDPEIRRRFAREARILRSYSHPNVVKVYDLVEQDYVLAMVLELVEGPSLVEYLTQWRGHMPLEEIRDIFRSVLEAVQAGHHHGVVHRDLKPENILVTHAGHVVHPKIVDFGIARILEGTTYTMTGAFLGTCCYMSPEQVQQPHAADTRSDIYSLGVTLYQLCTGQLPFQGNHFAVMMAHVNQMPRSPTELRGELPPALGRLILQALAKDPSARPASCDQFRELLEQALGGLRLSSPRVETPPFPPVMRAGDGGEMVLIPAGPFQMGRTKRTVYLDAFYIDRAPVTNREFALFLDTTGYRPTDPGAGQFAAHLLRGKLTKDQEGHPVVYVSWLDARAYSAWAGKRLPFEAEWEKAARGVDGRKYPWGRLEPSDRHANYGGRKGGTEPVGSHPEGASPYGILDMAGNVWEWCEDFDAPDFYEDGPAVNPRNEHPCERHVMRGGSYMFGRQALRTYARTSFEPHCRSAGGGFRCARWARLL
ncbi:SUMF1/EgtB/PvdO family nonheme iron enzyme [Myxococcota bacterium]